VGLTRLEATFPDRRHNAKLGVSRLRGKPTRQPAPARSTRFLSASCPKRRRAKQKPGNEAKSLPGFVLGRVVFARAAMSKLTKRTVDAAAADAADYFVWDDEVKGFGLRVWPSGRKSFVFKYQIGGRAGPTKRVTIGNLGAPTVEQARKRAAQLRADVFAGRSPADRAARTRAVVAAHEAPTVADVADAFLTESAAKLKPSTVTEYRRLLGVVPVKRGPARGTARPGELRAALGRYEVADVTRTQIAALHRGMAGRPSGANRMLAALASLFGYAERHGHRAEGTNPAHGVAPYREQKRERYLSDAEFARLGTALALAERDGLPIPKSKQERKATPANGEASHEGHRRGRRAPRAAEQPGGRGGASVPSALGMAGRRSARARMGARRQGARRRHAPRYKGWAQRARDRGAGARGA
jgi:hypothetical protein